MAAFYPREAKAAIRLPAICRRSRNGLAGAERNCFTKGADRSISSGMSATVSAPQHRNSLGYVIAKAGHSRSAEQAMIVWGKSASGIRVFIADATRGGADGLLCECGSRLVAKKGDVNAHHFAHEAGRSGACKAAHLEALRAFACRTLELGGGIAAPPMRGPALELKFRKSHIIDDCIFLECVGMSNKPTFVAVHTARRNFDDIVPRLKAKGPAAFSVDLSAHRHLPDAAIREALVRGAARKWIYYPDGTHFNSPGPHHSENRVESPSSMSNAELFRRLFPDLDGARRR